MARVNISNNETLGNLFILSKNEHSYTGKKSLQKEREKHDVNYYGISDTEETEVMLIVDEYIDNDVSHINLNEPHICEVQNSKILTAAPKPPVKIRKIIPCVALCNFTPNKFREIINEGLEKLQDLGKSTDTYTNLVMEELIAVGIAKRAAVWETGLERFNMELDHLKISKSFWGTGLAMLSNDDFLTEAREYISKTAPPIFTCLPFFGQKAIAARFLKNILSLVHCYIVKNEVNHENLNPPTVNEELSNLPASTLTNDLKAKQILYYVAGATIKSVCQSLPYQWCLVSAFSIKGTFQEVKEYLNNNLSDIKISAWVTQNNRGGLLYVNKTTFNMFEIIDAVASEFYNGKKLKCILQNNEARREKSLKNMEDNCQILEAFQAVIKTSEVPSKVNASRKILPKIFSTFLKLRGKGLQLYLRGIYFSKENKKQKSCPALRKGLKELNNISTKV